MVALVAEGEYFFSFATHEQWADEEWALPIRWCERTRDGAVQEKRIQGDRDLLQHRLFVPGTRLADGDFLIVISDKSFKWKIYLFQLLLNRNKERVGIYTGVREIVERRILGDA